MAYRCPGGGDLRGFVSGASSSGAPAPPVLPISDSTLDHGEDSEFQDANATVEYYTYHAYGQSTDDQLHMFYNGETLHPHLYEFLVR